jgi:hypothetical protein
VTARRLGVAGGIACALFLAGLPAWGLELARHGRPLLPIRVRADATEPELHAARELAAYLEKISGATFEIQTGTGPGPSIEVGWTAAIRAAGLDLDALGAEEWIVRAVDDRLWLTGGAPRGTLYAVYHFLEDDLGVGWWTPWDETVPRRKRLRVGALDRRGAPVFGYRDVFGVRGSIEFHLRNRLNGHYSQLPDDWGGSLRFGPPFHTHTFDRRVPAETWFDEHPEFFSEINGFRYGGETQWCLSQNALLDVVERDIRESIEIGEREAARDGHSPPLFYDVSQNDWRKPCECEACAQVVLEEGSQSGPLIRFVSRLAERIALERPDLKISTLAYHYSTDPPREVRAADSVLVRFTDLYQRDFAHTLGAPSNSDVRSAIRGWTKRAKHLQIWDYRVTFHDDGDLPRADHTHLGEQYRFYADLGVEGVFVQTEFADVADMRDLEVWLTAKLLEDPYQDATVLTGRFLRNYYGPAAGPIGEYLEELSAAVVQSTARLRSSPPADAYEWLDPHLVVRSQQRFDKAERRVAGRAELLARVRGARVALDRATLARWDELWPDADSRAPWPKNEVWKRYEATRLSRIDQRLFGTLQELAYESLFSELMEWINRDE